MELIKDKKKEKELQIAGDFNGWKLVDMQTIPKVLFIFHIFNWDII